MAGLRRGLLPGASRLPGGARLQGRLPGAVVLGGILLVLSCAAPQGLEAQDPTGDEAAVLEVIQELFDAMAARDPEAAEAVLLPEGYFISHREENGERVLSTVSHEEFLASMAEWEEEPLERIWDPLVMVHGGVAVAWTPYDFWWGGEFSHCGVNVFSLTDTPEGWQIASIVYTVERTGCEPSPLGPPDGG